METTEQARPGWGAVLAAPGPAAAPGRWGRKALVFARRKPLGALGAFLVALVLLLAIIVDGVAPYGYNQTSKADQLAPPSVRHLLGADHLGRDVLSRVLYGARVSVYIGFGAVAVAITLSTVLGLITGYYGGWPDHLLQRLVDAWMAFPGLVIALAMVSLVGPGVWQVILVIGLLFGIRNSRVVRGQVISVRHRGYIEAAHAIGAGNLRILLRHVLTNSMAPIIILATVEVPAVILIEASLSFLGFGIPPPFPSWGQMLSTEARRYMLNAPWMALAPGVALSLTVFAWNMWGDALRDELDPALRGSR